MTDPSDKANDPTRTAADRPESAPHDRRHPPADDTDTAGTGELWRGPSEARWIARLLRGAPPPRDSAPSAPGYNAHG